MIGSRCAALRYRKTIRFCRNPQTYTSSIHAFRCPVVTTQLRTNTPQRTSTPLVPLRGAPASATRDVGALRLSTGERLATCCTTHKFGHSKSDNQIGNRARFSTAKNAGDRVSVSPAGEEVLAFLDIAARTAGSLEITSIFA